MFQVTHGSSNVIWLQRQYCLCFYLTLCTTWPQITNCCWSLVFQIAF